VLFSLLLFNVRTKLSTPTILIMQRGLNNLAAMGVRYWDVAVPKTAMFQVNERTSVMANPLEVRLLSVFKTWNSICSIGGEI
jgi:hypothetical protein